MIFSSVDFPVPLRPISATRSLASTCNETLSRSGRWPYAIETRSSATSGTRGSYHETVASYWVRGGRLGVARIVGRVDVLEVDRTDAVEHDRRLGRRVGEMV